MDNGFNDSFSDGSLNSTDTESSGYRFGDTFQKVAVLISVIGMAGNLTVCYVVYRVRALRTMTNAFVVNQAVVDIVASFLIAVNHLIDPTSYYGVGGQFLCRVWKSRYLLWACFTASTYSLVAMTFERYFAIVYPLRYIATFTARKVWGIIGTVWFAAFVISSYPLFVNDVAPGGVCHWITLSKALSIALPIYVFVTKYLLPLLFMSSAYIHIALILGREKKITSLLAPVPSSRPTPAATSISQPSHVGTDAPQSFNASNLQTASLKKARRNVFKTLCLVFFAFVICWTPNQVYFMFYSLDFFGSFDWKVHEITVVLGYCNSCINPIIYALKYRSFRSGLRKALHCCNNGVEDSSLGMA
ncbi:probable G-protein coupled receptor No18 [Ptychodera flava]|uniref:probable G-protein coupled receptor No18 n=1 Tax=Ptychodera flava TaxID=63121 RepID=UPI00396A4E98